MSQYCDDFKFSENNQDHFVFGPQSNDSYQFWQGLRGPYFTPSVGDDGFLYWTNNGQLPNPEPVKIVGQDGVSPTVTISATATGHKVKITDRDHPSGQEFNVDDGDPGQDGISPAVTITTTATGHKVKITDRDHPSGQEFNVDDGEDGDPGPGVPAGGSAGQFYRKASATDYDGEWHTLNAGDSSYDSSLTYAAGTVGEELSSQRNTFKKNGLVDNVEVGGINTDGSEWAVTTRARNKGYIPGSYRVVVNSGYRIYSVYCYDASGNFLKRIVHNTDGAVTEQFVYNEGYYSRIVFAKTDVTATISTADCASIVNYIVHIGDDKRVNDALWEIDEKGRFVQGGYDTSGVLQPSAARLSVSGFISGSFHIETNSGFVMTRILKYKLDRTTIDSVIYNNTGITYYDMKNADGYIKIVFAKTNLTDNIYPFDDIIKKFYPLENYSPKLNEIRWTLAFNGDEFLQGGIDTDGNVVSSNARVYTKGLIRGSFHLKVKSGYTIFRVCKYNPDGTWAGILTNYQGTVTTEISIQNPGYLSRVVFAKSDFSSNISPADDFIDTINWIPDDTRQRLQEVENRMIGVKLDYVHAPVQDTSLPDSPAALYAVYDALVSDFPDYVTKTQIGTTRNVVTMSVSNASGLAIRTTYKIAGTSDEFAIILIDGTNVEGTLIGNSTSIASTGSLTDSQGVTLCTYSEGIYTNGDPLYKYDFKFSEYQYSTIRNKAFILGGVHGYEWDAMYGHMNFFNDLMRNWQNNDILAEIRQNADFTIIPLVNPWGFKHTVNYNVYGVDINRNFQEGYVQTERSDSRWSGPYALSEPESQAVNTQMLAAVATGRYAFMIDFHNDGSEATGGTFSATKAQDGFNFAFTRSMSEFFTRYYNIGKYNFTYGGYEYPGGMTVRQANKDGFPFGIISEFSRVLFSTDADKRKAQLEQTGNTILAMVRYFIEKR